MPAKKTTRSKAKTSGKTIVRRKISSSEFPCPNPGKKLSLEEAIRRMEQDSAFAGFISDLLCAAAKGDRDAQNCLDSYYDPTSSELSELCLTRQIIRNTCTVPAGNCLIAVSANVLARQSARRR